MVLHVTIIFMVYELTRLFMLPTSQPAPQGSPGYHKGGVGLEGWHMKPGATVSPGFQQKIDVVFARFFHGIET